MILSAFTPSQFVLSATNTTQCVHSVLSKVVSAFTHSQYILGVINGTKCVHSLSVYTRCYQWYLVRSFTHILFLVLSMSLSAFSHSVCLSVINDTLCVHSFSVYSQCYQCNIQCVHLFSVYYQCYQCYSVQSLTLSLFSVLSMILSAFTLSVYSQCYPKIFSAFIQS